MNLSLLITIPLIIVMMAVTMVVINRTADKWYKAKTYNDILQTMLKKNSTSLVIELAIPSYFKAFYELTDKEMINQMLRVLQGGFAKGIAAENRPEMTGKALGNISKLSKKAEKRAVQFVQLLATRHKRAEFVTELIGTNPKITCRQFIPLLQIFPAEEKEKLVNFINANDPGAAKLLVML